MYLYLYKYTPIYNSNKWTNCILQQYRFDSTGNTIATVAIDVLRDKTFAGVRSFTLHSLFSHPCIAPSMALLKTAVHALY